MRVKIVAKGGFAGLEAEGERDGTTLTALERQALDKLVESAHQFTEPVGADYITYTVTITDESGTREFKVPEKDMPKELRKIAKIKF